MQSTLFSLLFPSTDYGLECAAITCWWSILIVLLSFVGICEYVHCHWQMWCDRRRLRCFEEKRKARKVLRDLGKLRCGTTATPPPPGSTADLVKAAPGDSVVSAQQRGAAQSGSGSPHNLQRKASSGDSCPAATPKEPSAGGAAAPLHVASGTSLHDAAARKANAASTPDSVSARDSGEDATRSTSPSLPTSTVRAHRQRGAGTTEGNDEPLRSPEGFPALPTVIAAAEGESDPNSGSFSKRLVAPVAALAPSAILGRWKPVTTPSSPSGLTADGDSFLYSDASCRAASQQVGNHCCPRYSADEQRSLEKRRQENEKDWSEARRALGHTKPVNALHDDEMYDSLSSRTGPTDDCPHSRPKS